MNVLLAVDGSKYGRWATEWVARLPLSSPIRLTALHVVDLISLKAPLTPHPVVVWNEKFVQAESKRLLAHGKRVAKETKQLLASLDLKGKMFVQRGMVAPTILRGAKRGIDLIVLGSRGLGAIDRFMLGSISTNIIQQASCPVLVVKQPSRPIRRIVLATDGSKASHKAMQFLRRNVLAKQIRPNGATSVTEVDVMHIMPFLKYPELKEAGKAIVHQTAAQLGKAGFETEEVSRLGHPAEQILKYAEREKVDLIVTGARGFGAMARLFLGSTSTKLVHHSPCSVLVVR